MNENFKEIDKSFIKYKKAHYGLLHVLESDSHIVRVYHDRLAIYRKDGKILTWQELQDIKEEIRPNTIAIEYYPPKDKVVNKRHTRHLWLVDFMLHAHPEFKKY